MTILAVLALEGQENQEVEAWNLLTYFVSFGILGILWVAHTHHFEHIKHSNRTHHWINLGFLAVIALIPVATAAVGHQLSLNDPYKLVWSAFKYGVVLFVAVLMLFWNWWYATTIRPYGERADAKLIDDAVSEEEVRRLYARLLFALGLYVPPLILLGGMAFAEADCVPLVILSLAFYASHPLWAIISPGRRFVDWLLSRFIPASWYSAARPPSVH